MKTLLYQSLTFFYLCLMTISIQAQPEACGETPIMANNCADACVICDIDGFTGRNDLQAGGQNLGFVFCSTPNDMHFIAFIAGSTSLSIQIDVSNCSAGALNFRSLDLGFYESLDCQTFTPITECRQDLGNGTSYVFDTHTDLVIGQHYYLIMDGSAGSICDWTFTVLDGTTAVNPLEESGQIIGDSIICSNELGEYSVDFPVGAADFEWTVNGISLNENASTVTYEFPSTGTYELCVTSKNACDEAPPTCRQIVVESISVTEITDIFCEHDCYIVAGDTICETGIYEFVLQNQKGCDSIITADLERLRTPMLSIQTNICEGDTLFIGTTPFTQAGVFQEALLSNQACDSIVNLDLALIVCNIVSSDFPTSVICQGTATGQINFRVDNGTPPFSYTWTNLNNTHSGNGALTNLDEMATISNIPKGTYLITIEDEFGNSDIIISEVTEPEKMSLDFLASDYNGVNVTCATGMDGTLDVSASGGVPPYTYLWSSGQTSTRITSLSPINYSVTITDFSGCELVGGYALTAPSPLDLSALFMNAGCEGFDTGGIHVDQSSGGVPPYLYALNGGTFRNTTIFENLSPGTYTLGMMDDNGCIFQLEGVLAVPQIPVVDLGEMNTIELGDALTFNPTINDINIQSLNWISADSLSCNNCLKPAAIPTNSGTYTLEVESEDGCIGADSVFVQVAKVRKVFIPNAFSPDSDGINDFFNVFGAIPNVQMIEQLSIFDRWGDLLFEEKNLSPNEINTGWDGKAAEKALPVGVYTYLASVRFLDNEVLVYAGNVSLVR